MSNKKLNLVRETILSLASDDLAAVAGGVVSDCIPMPTRPRPSMPSPGPLSLPRPSLPPDGNPPSCLSLGNGLPR